MMGRIGKRFRFERVVSLTDDCTGTPYTKHQLGHYDPNSPEKVLARERLAEEEEKLRMVKELSQHLDEQLAKKLKD